ncbi:MAG: Na+/H+ antiporter NhaA [Gammaproteobacteria bacterium]|nr:Na+/H+ antiporter NhaA [Gammaproteobacteria bacterium]MCP4089856.1 Na+/H+ antiporter NhaA [Gammaproteobacteria bacterium]MCP4275511.1 Na+/H+ antiporter NhaA [Gammaproteobacteria bacterium]MCP4833003.1 Na+/H+ antiporter NhaA [Gammaproteobacteria bacterium]MCP4928625.1 Na+/H+ antiporter NhaA [Gammaproteobacteria bacterium]
MLQSKFKEFLKLEAAGGILLIFAAALAMMLKNSGFGDLYNAFLNTPGEIRVGALYIAKPLFLWVNDGLMAIFFFMIGMEVKREILIGELSELNQITLPAIAGVGGIIVPAGLYYLITMDDPLALQGWAIPTATDIAFALGILALVGPRVPTALKLFLMTLAIIDDLGAILIIAFFYTSELSTMSLSVAAGAIGWLFLLKLRKVTSITPYLMVGLILWVAVLKSGVHATLAGVILGFFIPLKGMDEDNKEYSPLDKLIHDLHPAVAFGILPLFAFANAGINLSGMSTNDLLSGIPLAIVVGLFFGKQIGVFGFAWVAIMLGLCKKPEGSNWGQIYGVALLCGVGFTMSLFVGSLAFEGSGLGYSRPDRLGIVVGSLVAGILGFIVLKLASKNATDTTDNKDRPQI